MKSFRIPASRFTSDEKCNCNASAVGVNRVGPDADLHTKALIHLAWPSMEGSMFGAYSHVVSSVPILLSAHSFVRAIVTLLKLGLSHPFTQRDHF